MLPRNWFALLGGTVGKPVGSEGSVPFCTGPLAPGKGDGAGAGAAAGAAGADCCSKDGKEGEVGKLL